MNQPPITLGRRADAIFQALRREIRSGAMGPGDRLPTQRELCERFSSSLPTVNRAIRRLRQERLVWTRVGAGAYVQSPPAAASALLGYMYLDQPEDLSFAQHVALERGYLLSVFSQIQNRWQPDAERQFLRKVLDQRHFGLLAFCSPTEPTNDDLLASLVAAGVRVLHVEHYRTRPPEQPYLLPDFEQAGQAAAASLLMARYRRVHPLLQTAPWQKRAPFATLIERGIARAMAGHQGGWDPAEAWREFPSDQDHQARLASSLARVAPDSGVVAYTIQAGIEAVAMLRQMGRDVPGDVGVIAIDVIRNADPGQCDVMSFHRPRLLERALDEITGPVWNEPRELVAPIWLKRGTLR